MEYYAHLRQQSRDFRQSLKLIRENINQHAQNLRDIEADLVGIENPEDFIPVAVPVNMRHTKHLPETRQRIFCDQLKQLISKVMIEMCLSTHLAGDSAMQKKYDAHKQGARLRSILNSVCAVCKGSCCFQGGDHAYLKVETLLLYMHQHPKLKQQQVLDEYLSRLPKKAYEDSCIYHTEIGCALPCHMRSESCSWFACNGLVEIEKHVIETKSSCFFIAAMEGKKVLRSAFVKGNQILGHHNFLVD